MSEYNYRMAVLEDVQEAVEEYMDWNGVTPEDIAENRDYYEEKIYEQLFTDDSVTGNGSGSYTFSTYQAEQNLSGNWGLMCEAGREFGMDHIEISDGYKNGAEYWDGTIRCYLLGECVSEVLDGIEREAEDV